MSVLPLTTNGGFTAHPAVRVHSAMLDHTTPRNRVTGTIGNAAARRHQHVEGLPTADVIVAGVVEGPGGTACAQQSYAAFGGLRVTAAGYTVARTWQLQDITGGDPVTGVADEAIRYQSDGIGVLRITVDGDVQGGTPNRDPREVITPYAVGIDQVGEFRGHTHIDRVRTLGDFRRGGTFKKRLGSTVDEQDREYLFEPDGGPTGLFASMFDPNAEDPEQEALDLDLDTGGRFTGDGLLYQIQLAAQARAGGAVAFNARYRVIGAV